MNLTKKLLSGYARRCAEKLGFSVYLPLSSAATPPIFVGKNGVRQRWRRSRKEGNKPNGKAQPSRTSGGGAANQRGLLDSFFKDHKQTAIHKNQVIINYGFYLNL